MSLSCWFLSHDPKHSYLTIEFVHLYHDIRISHHLTTLPTYTAFHVSPIPNLFMYNGTGCASPTSVSYGDIIPPPSIFLHMQFYALLIRLLFFLITFTY